MKTNKSQKNDKMLEKCSTQVAFLSFKCEYSLVAIAYQ